MSNKHIKAIKQTQILKQHIKAQITNNMYIYMYINIYI